MTHRFPIQFVYLLFAGLCSGYIAAWMTYRALQRRSRVIDRDSEILLAWPALGFIVPGLIGLFAIGKAMFGHEEIHLSFQSVLFVFLFPFSALIGVLDDRIELSGKRKLAFLLSSFLLLVAVSYINYFSGWSAPNEWFAIRLYFCYLCAPAALILIATPLLDGMDGLFAGFVAMVALFYGFMYPLGYFENGGCIVPDGWLSLLIPTGGFLLGVLPLNFLRPRLRVSEGIVLPMTLLLACAAMDNSISNGMSRWEPRHASWVRLVHWSYLPFIWPILDLCLVSVMRMRKGRSPFRGGHDHLHHRLVQSGLSSGRTLMALLGANLALILSFVVAYACLISRGMEVSYGLMEIDELGHLEEIKRNASQMNVTAVVALLVFGLLPLTYLFWRGYTKVDPYKSGAVDERGRP